MPSLAHHCHPFYAVLLDVPTENVLDLKSNTEQGLFQAHIIQHGLH